MTTERPRRLERIWVRLERTRRQLARIAASLMSDQHQLDERQARLERWVQALDKRLATLELHQRSQSVSLEALSASLADDLQELQAKTDDGLCPHGAKRIDCAACDRDSDIAYDAAREDRFFGRSRGRD